MTKLDDHVHARDEVERWKHDGVRVIPGDQLDPNVPSTPGMDRKAAINFARAGAQKLWAGTVTIKPNAKTGAHHHGHLESIIYVVRGRARMRWGDRLQFTAEANPGDFIFIPPYLPHQEINASTDQVLSACWFVVTDKPSRSISTLSRWRNLRLYCGWTQFIAMQQQRSECRVTFKALPPSFRSDASIIPSISPSLSRLGAARLSF
jgi:uncharacterized RmlC-like cupin family protein